MGWRDWSYWLRGGVFGAVLGLVGSTVFLLFSEVPVISNISFFFVLPAWLLLLPFERTFSSGVLFILGVAFSTIVYFIIGAIIGLIVGKIKSGGNS